MANGQNLQEMFNAALRHHNDGRLAEAASGYAEILQQNPDEPTVLYHLGLAQYGLGKWEDAAQNLQKVIALNPNDAQAALTIAAILLRLGDMDSAITTATRAVEINPDFADAHYNLGKFYQVKKGYDKAIEHGRRAYELMPEDADAAAAFYQHLQQACQWDEMAAVADHLDKLGTKPANQSQGQEHPFISISRSADLAANYRTAKARSDTLSAAVQDLRPAINHPATHPENSKISLGYISSDFRDHPLSHLMRNFFRLHNRDQFNIHIYSIGPDDGSTYRADIAASADSFTDLHRSADFDAVQKITSDGIDMLIDLNGHTTGARTEILALKPAPLQLTYLGFPGSSGADFIDYIVTDAIVTPPAAADFFSEKFLLMPETYYVTNQDEEISTKVYTRAAENLPDDAFVFACFSQSYKIEPAVFNVWMTLLEHLPNAVLWLFASNEFAAKNLTRAAVDRGIAEDRLVFARDLPKPDHLARLPLADLALDTLTYGGHTTTVDALGADIPVITVKGTHFASRASTSILTAIGLEELVCDTLEDYQSLAERLASQPAELKMVTQKLANNRPTAPLFDSPRFMKHFERGLQMAWETHRAGEPPAHIEVSKL